MATRLTREAKDVRGRVVPGVTHEGGYVCMRPTLKLEGVTYKRLDNIPAEVVARCRNASALLSRSWIIPVTDYHVDRHASGGVNHLTPTPRTLHHTERRALLEEQD